MTILRNTVSGALAAAMFFGASVAAQAAGTVKIAYIDPLSGSFANVGEAGLKHFQAMADEINAKGGVLGGKKIEIVMVPFDNKTSPQESLSQLKRVIDQDIHFVTQGNGSSVAGAIIEAVNRHNERNPATRPTAKPPK
jgi:branched-chain amino acid transport system substrate-binding protein